MLANAGKLQGYNLYVYCFNNPINLTDEAGNWPKFLKELWKSVVNAGKVIMAAINSFEAEAGVGAGLKAGVSLASVNVNAGVQMDVVNLKYSKKNVECRNKLDAELTVGAGPYKIGPQSTSTHSCICDSCNGDGTCPKAVEENRWFDENYSIELVGIELYVLIGFNASISFNFNTFSEELIKIYEE